MRKNKAHDGVQSLLSLFKNLEIFDSMRTISLRANLRANFAKQSPPMAWRLLLILTISLSACTKFVSVNPTPVVAVTRREVQNETPTPTLEPFRLTIPTPGAEPVSGWRPPLYPVPWAMSPYDHFYFTRPIAADQVNWPLADYRYGGIFDPPFVHTGVDIDAPQGTPILAAGPGTIVWADWGLLREIPGDITDPYGQAVVIRMDFGYKGQKLYTVYAHMSEIKAVVGQHVNTGDLIGLVGMTGHATGPHVHFEVRLADNTFYNTYNPELWMAPPQGWGVLVGRVMNTRGEVSQQLEVRVESDHPHQTRIVKTYGGGPTNYDPYYKENLVLGDLPAGIYKVSFLIDKTTVQTWVEIFPGQVSYFTFKGDKGFDVNPPPTPTINLLPVTATPSH